MPDETGAFALAALPEGTYDVVAGEDTAVGPVEFDGDEKPKRTKER